MLVNEIMTSSVRTVAPDTKLIDVVSVMCLYRISGLPVVEEDSTLAGFIAEKDVLHKLFPSLEDLMDGYASIDLDLMMSQYKSIVSMSVSDLMIGSVITVQPDMHILRAAAIMVSNKFRRIPVSESGRLVGVVSLGDVHKAIFQSSLASTLDLSK